MFKKIASVLALIAVLTVSLCSCGDDPVTMVMAISSDPLCLDPQIVESDAGRLIVANCFEGLVRLDKDNRIIPGAAESWDISADGLVYTFRLRNNSKWQLLKSYKDVLPDENYMETFDNRVTACDFEFGLKRTLDPVTQCNDAEKFFCIKNALKINSGEADKSTLGVKALDDFTLEITLERRNDDFLRLLTLAPAMPCKEEFFKETHAKYGLGVEYTFCNGPFYLSRWVDDNSLVIRKSEVYKGGEKVTVDAVYFNVNGDKTSVISKFKQNSYNCAFVDDAFLAELAETEGIQYAECVNTVSGICFNCADTVLENISLRQALASVINFNAVSKPQKAEDIAGGIVPDSCRFGEKSYRDTAGKITYPVYNEANARTLWQKGLTELERTSADIRIICTEEYTSQMQNVIQGWQRLFGTSIIAKVTPLSDEDFRTAVKNGKYQIAVGKISDTTSMAADTLKKFTTDSRSNVYGYSSEAYDRLVEQIIKTSAGSNIIADCKAAEQMLITDAVFFPLHTFAETAAFGEDVTGLFMTPDFKGINFLNGGLK